MSTIAKINGIAVANIAKIDGIAKANISKVNGISFAVAAWVSPTAIHSKCGESIIRPATNTIDGNITTFWLHSTSHEHWIIFDLGTTKIATKIRLYCTSIAATDVCEVSAVYINDSADESGGSKGSGSISSGTGWTEIAVTETSGRYIKLKLKTWVSGIPLVCGTSAGLSRFYEFEAYVS